MTSLQKLKDYRNNSSISQSELKALLSGKSYTKKPSLVMLIGSYVDCVLTCPHLKDDLYYVVDVSRPTDKIVELCESFYKWVSVDYQFSEQVIETDLEKYKGLIEDWIETVDYYSNRPKTRVEKFIKEAKEWWSVLVSKKDREIITSVEEVETELMCLRLKTDPELSWLWTGRYQVPVWFELEGVQCKALGDILGDNWYVDLKYTSCETLEEWWKVCASLNYPFQMAFYKAGFGFEKGYWLVVNKNWHQLIKVTDLMFKIGKWGCMVNKKFTVNGDNHELTTKVCGYMDGIDLINGKVSEQTTDEMFLTNLNV